MAIYILLSLITALYSEISVQARSKIIRGFCVFIVIVIPSLIYALRYGIGTDYFIYKSFFDKSPIVGFDSRLEWGYVLINLVVHKLNGNVEIVFFIVSLIMMSFIYFGAKYYSKSISVGVAMFSYMMLYYQMSFNAVRQGVAMAVCFYSFRYIHERKLIKFLICILIASSFHKSAFLVLPFYFLYYLLEKEGGKEIKKFFIYLLMMVFVLNIDKLLPPILIRVPVLSNYTNYLQNDSSDFSLGLFSRYIPFLVVGLYLCKYIEKKDNIYPFLISIYISSLILKLTGLVGAKYINRIAWNLEIVLILIIAYSAKAFIKRRELFASLILLYYVAINWWYIYIYTGTHETYPYRWIFKLQ